MLDNFEVIVSYSHFKVNKTHSRWWLDCTKQNVKCNTSFLSSSVNFLSMTHSSCSLCFYWDFHLKWWWRYIWLAHPALIYYFVQLIKVEHKYDILCQSTRSAHFVWVQCGKLWWVILVKYVTCLKHIELLVTRRNCQIRTVFGYFLNI